MMRATLDPSLAVTLAGITFSNPVLAAPGPLDFGREVQQIVDLRSLGGFITKSVTMEPRPGHPRPHVVEVEGGWLNSVGLRNPGLAGFLTKELPFLRTLGIPVVVSIAGATVDEYRTLTEWLSQEHGVAGLEVNVSCPNVDAGLGFGAEGRLTHALVAALRAMTPLPLIVKLSPNVADIAVIARAAADGGADALCCVNTLAGLAIDVDTRRPLLGAGTGGLSGPALRPVAVRMTWEAARATSLPVIGAGGILSARDALEFFLAGARAVAIASAFITDARAHLRILDGLRAYLTAHNHSSIDEIIGRVEGLSGESRHHV